MAIASPEAKLTVCQALETELVIRYKEQDCVT
jgi:hypothetical protein